MIGLTGSPQGVTFPQPLREIEAHIMPFTLSIDENGQISYPTAVNTYFQFFNQTDLYDFDFAGNQGIFTSKTIDQGSLFQAGFLGGQGLLFLLQVCSALIEQLFSVSQRLLCGK